MKPEYDFTHAIKNPYIKQKIMDKQLFDDLKEALQEMVDIENGLREPETFRVYELTPPPYPPANTR